MRSGRKKATKGRQAERDRKQVLGKAGRRREAQDARRSRGTQDKLVANKRAENVHPVGGPVRKDRQNESGANTPPFAMKIDDRSDEVKRGENVQAGSTRGPLSKDVGPRRGWDREASEERKASTSRIQQSI